MKPGVPLDRVSSEVALLGKQLAAKYPASNEGSGLDAQPLLEAMVGDVRKAMLVMLGAVGFVLLLPASTSPTCCWRGRRARERNDGAHGARRGPGPPGAHSC